MDLKKAMGYVREGFERFESRGVTLLRVPAFEKTGIVSHCFTTRKGGVSKGPFDSLNLSWKRYSAIEEIAKNYAIAAQAIGVDPGNLVLANSVHGDDILRVDEADRGRGLREAPCPPADALVTNARNVALSTMHADCFPVFIVDTGSRAIALCHSGWKGTVSKIASKAVRRMSEEFGTQPAGCLAAIGPGIQPCCFEVDENVANEFMSAYPALECVQHVKNSKYRVNIQACCLVQLLESGIPAKNITVSGLCTSCDADLFFSYRREKGETGAMASIIEIK
ncbi:MAG: peptidoglycan editing factor PgeF [Bacillota bacterium]|nr:peptidoglycan editing factor PgeF [Bacillota bacterium]